MITQLRVVVAAAVLGLGGSVCVHAQTPAASAAAGAWRLPAARTPSLVPAAGSLTSVVRDAAGAPVPGAIVSAVGGRTIIGTTDSAGRVTLDALPAGEYLVRVHRVGFGAANSLVVRITAGSQASHDVVLTRLEDRAVGTSGRGDPEVLAAGFAGVPPERTDGGETAEAVALDADHDHGETAWRLRHLPRSVLRDSGQRILTDGEEGTSDDPDTIAVIGRAVSAPARAAAALFTDVPFTGRVNLLTTGTVDDPARLLSDASFARGIAYVSLGAAAGRTGDWTVQGAMTEGDVASWMFAGSFVAREPATHRYEAGISYGAQRYTGSDRASLLAVADGTRDAGAVFAFDSWTLSRRATLVYGARYARYGYIDESLLSPSVRLEVAPVDGLRASISASRRAEAPGAEEFVPSFGASDTWLPPQRTFSPLSGGAFRPERTDTYAFALAHDISGSAVVGVRTFYQRTYDQGATLFGIGLERAPVSLDHYYVSSAGDFVARGWSVSVSQVLARRLRGSIDYTVTTAHWTPSNEADLLAVWAPSAVRTGAERLHDLTTSLETEVPYTATRVFALYRINTAFARSHEEQEQPGPAARFDVQLTQSLPFLNFTSAQWEMLVGIRNVFREIVGEASIYDELLVVRPPKRVVGGLTVRF